MKKFTPLDSKIEHLLQRLTPPQLALLIDYLRKHLPREAGSNKIKVNRTQLKAVCKQLVALLADDDARVTAVFNQHKALLQNAFTYQFNTIQSAMHSFDFDGALLALKQAIEAHEIDFN